MKSGFLTLGLAFGFALSSAVVDAQRLHAEEDPRLTPLMTTPLSGVEGMEARVHLWDFPPGWVGSKHYHLGDVFVYVLEGTFVSDFEDGPRRTVKAGEILHEAPETVEQPRNASATEWLKVVVFEVSDEDVAWMVMAK